MERKKIRAVGSRMPLVVLAVAVVGVCAGSIAKAWSPSTPAVTASVFASLDDTADMARDTAGNVYVVGLFIDPFDADPGSGTTNLTSAGDTDAYILKLDASGNLVWAHRIGGTGADQGSGVAVDSSGNVYVTGAFNGTVDLNPDPSTAVNIVSSGARDVFVLKLDTTGAFQWGYGIGGGSADDIGRDVAVDSSGNPHFIGSFVPGADFDPGAGTVSLPGFGSFILKMTPAGAYTWAGKLGPSGGGSSGLAAQKIAVDNAGSIVVVGYFNGINYDFDPGVGTANLSSSDNDGFVVKLTLGTTAPNNPEYSWSRRIGGLFDDYAESLAFASSGAITIVGRFRGGVAFNPTDLSNPASLTAPGPGDGFALNLSSTGVFQWVAQFTGTNLTWPRATAADSLGNVYIGGQFGGSADFDPGAGTATVASAAGFNAFIVKLDSTGTFVWVRILGSTGGQAVAAMVNGPADGVLVAGYSGGSADFDLESGTANLGVLGTSNAYVMLISSAGATADTTTSSTTSSTSSTSSTTSTVASSTASSTTVASASSTTAASATSSTASSTTVASASSTPAVPSAAAARLFAPKAIIVGDTEKVNQGDEIELSAGGFSASESVIVGFVGSPDNATTVTASASGKARATLEVPASATGRVTAYMYGATSKKGFKQVLTLASLPATGRDEGSPLLAGFALALVGVSVLMLRRRISVN
jgi:LPXTG-motif cell wall-anchored protein